MHSGNEQVFGYPQFSPKGEKILTQVNGSCSNMLMDINVYRLKKDEVKSWESPSFESAFLLVEGDVIFSWVEEGEVKTQKASRGDFFAEGAYCLHVPKGVKVTIQGGKNARYSEILLQMTKNEGVFESRFYTPENSKEEYFGEGQFDGKAKRAVRTFFDYHTAPYSNMVCGEILVPQGGWSSYPPHQHPQPEVYYYRFSKPQGFGACFIGEDVFTIRDGSFSAIPGGKCHPQVNAPGYSMYYVWMIRHFDNAPWIDRVFDEDHKWLLT